MVIVFLFTFDLLKLAKSGLKAYGTSKIGLVSGSTARSAARLVNMAAAARQTWFAPRWGGPGRKQDDVVAILSVRESAQARDPEQVKSKIQSINELMD